MLNYPWIDPRDVDFTDPFNVIARFGRAYKTANPFLYGVLKDPTWQALRNAKNLEPRIYTVPDQLDQLVGAGLTYDQNVCIEPGTWLYAVNATGNQDAGFQVQITDASTGAVVFSQPITSQNLSPTTQAPGGGLLCFLSAPRYFNPPAYPIVRIINMAAMPQICQVNLFTALELMVP